MTWFAERQLDYCPVHFKKASTPIDDEKSKVEKIESKVTEF